MPGWDFHIKLQQNSSPAGDDAGTFEGTYFLIVERTRKTNPGMHE
jgi:hypothetical protein